MDMQKFRSMTAQGNFSEAPEDYASWSEWADLIRTDIRVLETRHAHQGSGVPMSKLEPLVTLCAENPESALHVVVLDMMQCGTSWSHLRLLRKVAELAGAEYPDIAGIRGEYLPQVVQALTWYQSLVSAPSDDIRIEHGSGYSKGKKYQVDGILGGTVEVEVNANDMCILITESDDEVVKVLLSLQAAEQFTRDLAAMVALPYRERTSVLLRAGMDEFIVRSSNMGEPFRETLDFKVTGPEWKTYGSVEVTPYNVAYMVQGMADMLGITLDQVKSSPQRRPR